MTCSFSSVEGLQFVHDGSQLNKNKTQNFSGFGECLVVCKYSDISVYLKNIFEPHNASYKIRGSFLTYPSINLESTKTGELLSYETSVKSK